MVFKSLYNTKFFEKFYDEMESVCALIDALEIDNEKERKNIFDFSKNKKIPFISMDCFGFWGRKSNGR